jgi:hypothetical protein
MAVGMQVRSSVNAISACQAGHKIGSAVLKAIGAFCVAVCTILACVGISVALYSLFYAILIPEKLHMFTLQLIPESYARTAGHQPCSVCHGKISRVQVLLAAFFLEE